MKPAITGNYVARGGWRTSALLYSYISRISIASLQKSYSQPSPWAVHKVRHASLANFAPRPCHTLSHIPGPTKKSTSHTSDPSIFSNPSKKIPDKNLLYKFSLNCFRGFLSGRFSHGVFSLEGFVRGGFCPFPLLSEYICYNRKVNLTLNFMFHMYDKKMYTRD